MSLRQKFPQIIARARLWSPKSWPGFRERSYFVFDYLSKIALVCGIFFSIYQFSAYKRDERVRYTINFYEKFDSERFLNARSRIEAAIRSHENVISELNSTRVGKDAETAIRHRIAHFLANDSNGGKGIVREIELVVDFFDGLHVCLGHNLCDNQVAKAFLISHARMLWINFSPYIKSRRKLIPSFGRGLEAFAVHPDAEQRFRQTS